jgi:hypothetical protein
MATNAPQRLSGSDMSNVLAERGLIHVNVGATIIVRRDAARCGLAFAAATVPPSCSTGTAGWSGPSRALLDRCSIGTAGQESLLKEATASAAINARRLIGNGEGGIRTLERAISPLLA